METRYRRQSYNSERSSKLTVPGQSLRRSPRNDRVVSNQSAAPPFSQRNALLVAIQESNKSNMVRKRIMLSESSADEEADDCGSHLKNPPSHEPRSQEFKNSIHEKFVTLQRHVNENRNHWLRIFAVFVIFVLIAVFAFWLIPMLSPLFEGLRNTFLKLEDFLHPVSDFPIKTSSPRFDQVEEDGIKDIAKKLLTDKRFQEMVKSFAPEIMSKDDLRMKELISRLEAEIDFRGESIRKDFRSAFEELETKFQHVKSDVEAFQKENEQRAEALRQGILLTQELPQIEQSSEFESQLNHLKNHFDTLADKVEEIALTINNCQKKGPEIEQMVQSILKQHNQRPNLDLENWAEEHISGIKSELKSEIVPVLHQSVKDQIQKATSEIRSRMDKIITTEQPLSTDEIVKMVQEALTTYDADKTGLFDFALESAGGSIESTRCTEDYEVTTATMSVFGISLPNMWKSRVSPRAILEPGTSPGNCWAFKGSTGAVVIRLSSLIHIGAVTMEHTAVSNAPDGNITSAPKEFQVFGLNHVNDNFPVLLGNFTYKHPGHPVQTFYLPGKPEKPFQIVELQINSNHGNPAYTCLYRFRVHGSLDTNPSFRSS